MDLTNKVVLLTGGTLGIGAATAKELARRGADLSLVARTVGEDAKKLQQEIQALGRKCLLISGDMSKGAECGRVVMETISHFGNLHVLIHNAGGPSPGKVEDIKPEQWEYTLSLHVSACYYLCYAALPQMRKNKEGAIITISSTAGIRGVPGAIAYATAKGALPQFTRSLARDLGDDNIRVNCIAPGIIRTRFHADMPEERKQHNLANRIPLHREGTPEQVADVISMLVTNDYITGETVVIDGGLTSRIV